MSATKMSLCKRSLVHGVGVNDADYDTQKEKNTKVIWRCPFYDKWINMLKRCYSPLWHKQYPTYIGCSVCPEWRYFSKFRLWMENQKWEGMALDKDLLVKGNQVYGPDTCCFLPTAINCLFGGSKKKINLDLPQGVTLTANGKYRVQIQIRPDKRYRKTISSFKEACRCALEKKIEAVRYGAHDPRLEVKVILALGGHIHEMQETIKSI
jgi:hypothetical protein